VDISINTMKKTYIDSLLQNFKPYSGYQSPTKHKEDYQQEITQLEKEIEIAKTKMEKATPRGKKHT